MSSMFETVLTWSSDMTTAPKGEYVTTTRTILVKGEPQTRSSKEHVPTKIMALTNCGKVVSTYWIPGKYTASGSILDGDRWSGFNRGSVPVLWAHWPDADDLLAHTKAEEAA